ncbi:unnamed protein product [Pylaiella littoralis]
MARSTAMTTTKTTAPARQTCSTPGGVAVIASPIQQVVMTATCLMIHSRTTRSTTSSRGWPARSLHRRAERRRQPPRIRQRRHPSSLGREQTAQYTRRRPKSLLVFDDPSDPSASARGVRGADSVSTAANHCSFIPVEYVTDCKRIEVCFGVYGYVYIYIYSTSYVLLLILTLAHYRRSLARGHKPGIYRAKRNIYISS